LSDQQNTERAKRAKREGRGRERRKVSNAVHALSDIAVSERKVVMATMEGIRQGTSKSNLDGWKEEELRSLGRKWQPGASNSD
jgi:hypothetical protein